MKTAVVTGAGRGIGKAIALSLAQRGMNLVVASRTSGELEAVCAEIRDGGGEALPVRCDVASETDVTHLVDSAMRRYGTIDVLVNNAGVGFFSAVKDLRPADFDTMWSVNMRGAFLCSKAVLPHMIASSSGDIVNIASLAGRNAFVNGAGYAATKWALIGFSRCLMLEVRKHNIRVVTICPGSVDTSFAGPSGEVKSGRDIPLAADIAQVVVDALAMPRNVMVSEIDIRPTNP